MMNSFVGTKVSRYDWDRDPAMTPIKRAIMGNRDIDYIEFDNEVLVGRRCMRDSRRKASLAFNVSDVEAIRKTVQKELHMNLGWKPHETPILLYVF